MFYRFIWRKCQSEDYQNLLEKEIAVTILSGFNLPILLEIVLATKELTKEDIQELVNKCQQELKMTILDEVHVVNEEEDFLGGRK